MQQELAEKRVKVLPILKDRCDIPNYLRDKVYADFTDPNGIDARFSDLLDALGVERHNSSVPEEMQGEYEPDKPKQDNLQAFVDIAIRGVDKERTYNPNPSKALYRVYFELSGYPPQEWVEIFDAERQFPRHTMWREAYVDGKHIVVYCVPHEVKKYHARDIKKDVDTCNQKYRAYLHAEAIRRAKEQREEQEERHALGTALEGLDF